MKRGIEVEIYALSYLPTGEQRISFPKLEKMINFQYRELEYRIGKMSPLRMKKIPSLVNTDLIYIMGAYYYFLKQCLKLNSPKVYGFHDPALQSPKNLLQKRIVKNLFPKFSLIHLLNKWQLKMIPSNSNHFLLENTWFGELPKIQEKFEKFTVLFFGRHEESKGLKTLEYVAMNFPDDSVLNIAGSGSVPLNLLHPKNNVNFLGFLDDNELYYNISRSHAVLFPSFSEASSIVAIESISHSTPVIYRNIPQNFLLERSDLCLKCTSDEEFLTGVIKLGSSYEENPQEYLNRCKGLPSILMSKDDYFNTLISSMVSIMATK